MFDKLMLEKLVEKELEGLQFLGLAQIRRVRKNSEEIKKGLHFNEEILELSVMLHNIGAKQWLQFNQDLAQTSLAMAKIFLRKINFSLKEIPLIEHCIQEIGLNGKPKTTEARILHDSVMLDEIGAIGVLKDSFVFSRQKKSVDEIKQFLRAKSFHLKNAFFTEKGEELSREGIEFYVSFVELLEKEL